VQTLTDGMGSSCIFISVPPVVSCKALNLHISPLLLYDLFTCLPFPVSFSSPCPGLVLYSVVPRAWYNPFLLFLTLQSALSLLFYTESLEIAT